MTIPAEKGDDSKKPIKYRVRCPSCKTVNDPKKSVCTPVPQVAAFAQKAAPDTFQAATSSTNAEANEPPAKRPKQRRIIFRGTTALCV